MNNCLFQFRELINTDDNIPKKPRGIDELAQFIDFESFRPFLLERYNSKKIASSFKRDSKKINCVIKPRHSD